MMSYKPTALIAMTTCIIVELWEACESVTPLASSCPASTLTPTNLNMHEQMIIDEGTKADERTSEQKTWM